ncbi:MAG: prepilin-type N-terminal cleavage/methylation domain-containing protein [Planctomycetes bacterium]|nr:prepilin-type N-terminal cleavage/methylation domain-containing protein [Planctomycetota bacterium]
MTLGDVPGGERRKGPAFTIVELMVVIAVIAVLVAMVLPSMRGVFEVAYATMCRRNLKGLSDAMHTSQNADMTIPTPDSWVGTVIGRGCKQILHCVKDNTEPSAVKRGLDALQDYYILQYHTSSTTRHDTSYLTSILGLGGPAVNDPQIWAWWPAAGLHQSPKGETWPPQYLPTLKDNQAFIGVDNDSALLITFGDTITFETWEPPPYNMGGAGHSRHWVMKGPGHPKCPVPIGDSPQSDSDKEILHMFSLGFVRHDPRSPYGIPTAGRCSYGMNGLLEPRKWRPGQFMLMDANETRIDIGTANYEEPLEDVVMPRHMGKANVLTVGGSVKPMSLLELEMERDSDDGRWYFSHRQ